MWCSSFVADESLIRLENLRRLNLSAGELSSRVGGRYTYWRDLLAGKKSFGEKIARKIEEKLILPRGSLDFAGGSATSEWPFPDIDRARFDRLTEPQKLEIQGAVRKMLQEFEGSLGNGLSNGHQKAA